MKICKKDIGKTFLVTLWFRGCSETIAKKLVLEKVGRVYLTLSGLKYKIIRSNEFMIKATNAHESDSHIKIYEKESDISLDKERGRLAYWFSELASFSNKRKIESLTLGQLKEIKVIFERGE